MDDASIDIESEIDEVLSVIAKDEMELLDALENLVCEDCAACRKEAARLLEKYGRRFRKN